MSKVAKNMDSVFDNCTQDQLEFEAMFDQDDCLIDIIAGVNEAGELITGEEIDINECDEYCDDSEREGECKHSDNNAEGTKEKDLEIGGEVGDGKEVSGKENSEESKAYDDKKEVDDAIGLNDDQQVKLEDTAEGPLEDDDEAERSGEVEDTTVATESAPDVTEALDDIQESVIDSIAESIINKIKDKIEQEDEEDLEEIAERNRSLAESEDPIADTCDNGERAGAIKHDTSDVEGKSAEVVGAAIDGDTDKDVINLNIDDEDMRDGKTTGQNDQEGVKVHAIGASLEAAGDIDEVMSDDDMNILDLVKGEDKVVPDSVQKADDANEIDIKKESIVYKWDHVTEAEKIDIELEDEDEQDIEMVDKNVIGNDEELDFDYEYDDDELIDSVINNDVDKVDIDLED